VCDIEHQSARRLGHVHGVFASEPEADIIFWQEHSPEALPNAGLMFPHPQQVRQSEIGQCGIAGEFDNPRLAEFCVQPITLRLGPLVAPDERWPEYLIIFVKQYGPVHLAGKAYDRDV